MKPILKIALRAARQFNEYVNLTIDRKEHGASDVKEDLKLVSHLEEVLFKTLMDALKKGYPTHYVAEIGEQVTDIKEDAWFITSFDNTENLLRKIADTTYSFVYKKNGKLHSAVIINPFTGAEYVAVRGSGASFNDHRCRVTELRSLDGAYFASDAANQFKNPDLYPAYCELAAQMGEAGIKTRVSNCATQDLALVASGQLDGALLTSVKTDELEAALLLCQEAGALVGDLKSGMVSSNNTTLAVAHPKLFKATIQRFAAHADKLES